eukprot:2964921-Rhodomonas_salina.1
MHHGQTHAINLCCVWIYSRRSQMFGLATHGNGRNQVDVGGRAGRKGKASGERAAKQREAAAAAAAKCVDTA